MVFHRPKPKKPKPKPNVRPITVHQPGKRTPPAGVAFAVPPREKPSTLVFHAPKPKGQQHEPGQPNGSCWEFDGEGWRCVYGCKFLKLDRKPDDNDWHAYDCQYWWEEGIDEAPF